MSSVLLIYCRNNVKYCNTEKENQRKKNITDNSGHTFNLLRQGHLWCAIWERAKGIKADHHGAQPIKTELSPKLSANCTPRKISEIGQKSFCEHSPPPARDLGTCKVVSKLFLRPKTIKTFYGEAIFSVGLCLVATHAC